MADFSLSTEWLKNLPNKLTLARIGAIPLLLVLYPLQLGTTINVISAVIFLLAALTDLLDGYLARKYQNVTPLGALLDPIADKMLVAASLVLLASTHAAPALLAGLLICRDIAVNGVRLLALEQGITVAVNDLGKWKTAATMVAIFCLFINDNHFLGLPFRTVGMIALWLGLGLSLYSAWTYGRGYLEKSKIGLGL